MSALTGEFDIALQLRQGAINRLFAAMHRAGSIDRRSTHVYRGKRVELQIGRPTVSLLPQLQADRSPRALLRSRVHYHARALDNPADPGVTASADVTIRAAASLPGGNPAAVDEGSQIVIGWAETTAADVAVQGISGLEADEVRDAILDFVRSGAVRLGVPMPGGVAGATGTLGLRYIAGAQGGEPVAAIGLDIGLGSRGSVQAIQQDFSGGDWALAVSEEYVLRSIRDAVRRWVGRLPPPLGPSPVIIADERVCTLSAPVVGCVDYGQQQVVLEWLEIGLAFGAVVVSGRVTQRNTAWYVPPVTANFTLRLTVRFDQAARTLVVSADRPVVQIQQWYAQVFDFLSNRSIESAIREGMEDALLSRLGGDGLTSLFSSAVLQRLVTLGGTANIPVGTVVSSVETRPEGIIIHGALQVAEMSAPPEAALMAFPSGRSPGGRLFNAAGSWAPGGDVVSYEWSFGDGQTASSSGAAIAFATQHEYAAPGTYQACVTVTDGAGRRASRCVSVRPRTLRLEHRVRETSDRLAGPWRVCAGEDPVECEFVVLDEFAPVSGATVTLSTASSCDTAVTDSSGSVRMTIHPERFEPVATVQKGAFAVGRMKVEADKDGYAPAADVLVAIDCASAQGGEWLDARRQLQTWLERHAQLNVPAVPGDRMNTRDPRAPALLADAGLVLDLFTRLFVLAERGSSILPAERILGLEIGDRSDPRRVAARVRELLAEADAGLASTHGQLDRMLGARDNPGQKPSHPPRASSHRPEPAGGHPHPYQGGHEPRDS